MYAIPIVLDNVMPHVRIRVFHPFLFSILALGEIETGLILIFEVEDHGDAFVFLGVLSFS